MRMIVPAPMVSRSVHTGTWWEKTTAPRPTLAPSALRYIRYSGEPAVRKVSGFDRTSVLTSQKRTYARLQMRILVGFHRPTSSHFAPIGRVHTARKAAPPNSTDRR